MLSDVSYDLEIIIQQLKNDVEKKLKDIVQDEDMMSILDGGKRLRPLLSYFAFKSCTQGKETKEQYQKFLEASSAIELSHSASLVHDDIIDGDKVRRCKKSFYIKKDIPLAILMGHKMISLGLKIALKRGIKFADMYVDTWNDAVIGEYYEIEFNNKYLKGSKKSYSKEKIFDEYNKIMDMKTASLFSAACKSGAIEANALDELTNIFAEYGKEIGIAYQLADDLVDMINGEIIYSVIIPLLNKLEDTIVYNLDSRNIKKLLGKNLDKIKDIFIKETKERIEKANELGRSELIPESKYKNLLEKLPTYIINKTLEDINIIV